MKELHAQKTESTHITMLDFDNASPVNLEWSWGEPFPKTQVYAIYNSNGIGFKFVSEESPVTVNYFENNSSDDAVPR